MGVSPWPETLANPDSKIKQLKTRVLDIINPSSRRSLTVYQNRHAASIKFSTQTGTGLVSFTRQMSASFRVRLGTPLNPTDVLAYRGVVQAAEHQAHLSGAKSFRLVPDKSTRGSRIRISAEPSVLWESTMKMSSAHCTEPKQRGRFSASFLTRTDTGTRALLDFIL